MCKGREHGQEGGEMAGRDDRRTPVISRKEKTKGEQKKEHEGAKTFLFLVIIPPLCQSRLPTATTTATSNLFFGIFSPHLFCPKVIFHSPQ